MEELASVAPAILIAPFLLLLGVAGVILMPQVVVVVILALAGRKALRKRKADRAMVAFIQELS